MPVRVRPMLASSGELPDDPERWGFEVKWDGARAIVFARHGELHVDSRSGSDLTGRFPELTPLAAELASHDAILDGEVVAFASNGVPDFQALQERLALDATTSIARAATRSPTTFVAFDLLYLDGQDLRQLPYIERRSLLRALLRDGPRWTVPAHHVGSGESLLDAVAARGLEGVVAKRIDSPYVEGARSRSWLKIKRRRLDEFLVYGWREGSGSRASTFGALLLAGRGPGGALEPVGSVGSGFDDATLRELRETLDRLEVADPAVVLPASRSTDRRRGLLHFVRPVLSCEVAFTERTRDGTLRHPAFRSLVHDRQSED